MVICDWCDLNVPRVNGWHYITDADGIEGTARIPCAIVPPAIETVAGP